jgi:hypothetical protein
VSIGLAREIEENDPLTIAIQKEEAEIIKKSGGGKNPSRPGKPKDDDM